MENLEVMSGLPISFQSDTLVFRDGIAAPSPEARTIEEVRPYLEDGAARAARRDAYLMYRGVMREEDRELFSRTNLRYDITVIFPGNLGREFPKTIGHVHAVKPGTSLTYPEVYEVLSGTAYFLFQRMEAEGVAGEVYLVVTEPGEKVVVPPGFGHVTVNPKDEPLIVANLFRDNVTSDYTSFKSHRGGAYYVGKYDEGVVGADTRNGIAVARNGRYRRFDRLSVVRPREVYGLGIDFGKPLYRAFTGNPTAFAFLDAPEEYEAKLVPEAVFEEGTVG
jgi:glucose-6-phosphate isomerase